MILQDLLIDIENEIISKVNLENLQITNITDSSRDVKEGSLFLAISGYKVDGHDYIQDAIRLGAAAVIGEKEISDVHVPYIRVRNSRKALGLVAKRYYGNPSKNKIIIGITGTNGKTTTSFMLKQILEDNGITCTLIGTLNYLINGKMMDSQNTTPGTIKLNSLLAESNDKVVIMEVSSHGLAQYRLEGIEFDHCIFTNLYHEHLDFHGTMEEYFRTKIMLFEKLKPNGIATIHLDHEWGRKLHVNLQKKKVKTTTIGKSIHSDITILDYQAGDKPSIVLKENLEQVQIDIPMPGLHNLNNAAIAYAVARTFSIQREKILESLRHLHGIPGRFEQYYSNKGSTIVIDYAHTADAISYTLQTAKECGAKKVYHIFGFRGGRDPTKRTEMVQISTEFSDELILTMDDLNSEKYEDMVQDLNNLHEQYSFEKGMVIPDRTLAIQRALDKGTEDDWIIITGKGPENYKENFAIPTKSDKETVQYFLNNSVLNIEEFLK